MKNVNWDTVQDDVRRPVPGGYAAKITRVEDDENKEYLRIEWEFAEGEFKGANQETYDAFGFWPMTMFRSYKEKALRFFKAFKIAVEESNRNFVFKNDPQSLVGKFIGVVLGEEEYLASDGKVKTRLYVSATKAGNDIRDGNFTVPELKKLATAPANNFGSQPVSNYDLLDDNDADCPF